MNLSQNSKTTISYALLRINENIIEKTEKSEPRAFSSESFSQEKRDAIISPLLQLSSTARSCFSAEQTRERGVWLVTKCKVVVLLYSTLGNFAVSTGTLKACCGVTMEYIFPLWKCKFPGISKKFWSPTFNNVVTFSKTRDLSLGPLALQPDTLPTELSGLGRILCKSMGICISVTENIVPHGRHFLPLEKFPPLGNRISLGQVPYSLASLRKGNCPLEIRFPSGGNFFHGKKTLAVWEIYIPR